MNLLANLLTPKPQNKDETLLSVAAAAVQQIYLTGCAGKDVARLPELLKALDAVLIDIRFAPPAKPIEWSKPYLKLLLKGRYLHVPTLGDRAAKESGGAIAIQNLALGIKVITELKVNLLLMCECRREDNCHRRVIRNKLAEQGSESRELEDWELVIGS